MKRLVRITFGITLLAMSGFVFAEGQMDDTPCEYTSQSDTRYNPKADIREIEEANRPQPTSTVIAQ